MKRLFGKVRRVAQAGRSQQAGTATEAAPTADSTAVDSFTGEVRLFAGNFAPLGWALCHGQLLLVHENVELFSLLATTYGGDGRTTFGLPDLRGRAVIGAGQLVGLPDHRLGQFGTEAPGDGTPDHGYLALHYIISLNGVFPPRT